MKATREAKAATVGAVSPEQVATIKDVSEAEQPKPFEISTMLQKMSLKFLKLL